MIELKTMDLTERHNRQGESSLTPPNVPSKSNNTVAAKHSVKKDEHSSSRFVDPGCYERMEKKASWYLTELQSLAQSDNYLEKLTGAYEQWANDPTLIGQNAKLSVIEQKMQCDDSISSLSFLQKLSVDKQLKRYLDKSLTYIFMRDLGKSIHSKNVIEQIDNLSHQIQRWVRKNNGQGKAEIINNNLIDRKAREYDIEDTVSWLKTKLLLLEKKLPDTLDKTNGLRKLVKVIAGVVMHRLTDMPKNLPKSLKSTYLESAIRLGYWYGLTYPLIDDIQDSASVLNAQEKEGFNMAIRESLLRKEVAVFPTFRKTNHATMSFIYEELKSAFEGIKSYQSNTHDTCFFEHAFVFFEAQNIDRKKSLKNGVYTDEALFLPVILKSAGSRIVARDIVQSTPDKNFDHRTFCFGIYNQFNDDIKDLFADIEEDNVTPYNHYYVHASLNTGNVNPYRIYWSVVFYLITEVYDSDKSVTQLLLERSINAHKSLKNSVGSTQYKTLERRLLNTGNRVFDTLISKLVNTPNQVAWFDKLISREVSLYFNQQRQSKQDFEHYYKSAQSFIDQNLTIEEHKRIGKTQLLQAANYALEVGGKRLRPVLAYITLTQRYDFTPEQTIPVLQLLEYMHTASLVFDDKPSQDNASVRRGKPALHEYYKSEAQAELTGVYMIMKAVEVQTTIKGVSASNVLASIEYAANTTQAICEGQLLDLKSSCSHTSLDELEHICFLKTSLAIEAAIIIPAILGAENDIEKGNLKRFAKYLGLVFQLKDDLLDAEGTEQQLGKPVQQDKQAQKASFVTLLGKQGAREKLYYYRGIATECLGKLSTKNAFYEQLLDYVVHRHH